VSVTRSAVQIELEDVGPVGTGGPEPAYTYWTSRDKRGWTTIAFWRVPFRVGSPWDDPKQIERIGWQGEVVVPRPGWIPGTAAVQITAEQAQALLRRGKP